MRKVLWMTLCASVLVFGTTARVLASLNAPPESRMSSQPAAPQSYVITGIHDIRSFLEHCPTTDPAYSQIRADFELRLDGNIITSPIPCTEPISALPIDQFSNELIALQVLRTAY